MGGPRYDAYFSLSNFGGEVGRWAWPPRVPLMSSWFEASKFNQKVGPLGGPFGLTAISKWCFRNSQGGSPLPTFTQLPRNFAQLIEGPLKIRYF